MDLTDTWNFQAATPPLPPPMEATQAQEPARGAQIVVRLNVPAQVQLTVLDLAGRRIAVLPEAGLKEGANIVQWDGRTATGRNAPAGPYLARVLVRGKHGKSAQTITMVRQ